MSRPDPRSRSDTLVLQGLERHQRRREQGIPTLTVLAGPPGTAVSLWHRWLTARGLPPCTVLTPDETGVARAWMEALARARSLPADAADHLGAAAGLAPGELRSRLEGKSGHERGLLLRQLLAVTPGGDVSTACHHLLHDAPVPWSPSLPGPLDSLLHACEGDVLRALAALHALVPPGTAPALLLAGSGAEWLARAARVAARLCAALPSFVSALTVDRAGLDVYLRGSPSQAQAMVREGLLELEAPPPEALEQRLEALGVRQPGPLSGSLRRLAADGVSEELLGLFGTAARELEAAAEGEAEARERARSAAERFLFERLESLPATHGVFELNASPGFRIADRPVEVDLLARELAVALELDGFHHFREPEAYRRDRRKDLALQRHGYLVLRFLADDVVARLEEILNTISEVISLRREGSSAGPRGRNIEDGGTRDKARG